jgi:hypothetical protein
VNTIDKVNVGAASHAKQSSVRFDNIHGLADTNLATERLHAIH